MLKKIKQDWEKFNNLPRNSKIASALTLIFIILLLIASQYFPILPLVVIFSSFLVLFIMYLVFAGMVVFNSIAKVSAKAGIIASVIIFLTTSYCDLPENLRTANESMKFIFDVGVLCGGIYLIKSLYGEIKKILKESKKGDGVAIFLFLVCLFIVLINFFYVIRSITLNLCIFSGS